MFVAADTAHRGLHGCVGGSFAAAPDEVAASVLRHEFPYLLFLALCPPLVRSLEYEMVCGL